MKIYTKTGDGGTTSLIGGRRVSKADVQVEAYGTLDELNSWLGLVACDLIEDAPLHKFLLQMQGVLLKIGGFYSFDFASGKSFDYPFVEDADIEELERWIDELDATLPPLDHFILPGGTPASCHAHIARTVCRRAERALVGLVERMNVEATRACMAQRYINRLSDFLFVLARYQNEVPKVSF
ncbi:MAG: cob(I)yrinic acid a,c-diamide adenosyltransferase [Bacteroidales bacterium]|nr:cob(I)yrinic acid a,c-diamide adenosyltransferase [Bacteroidales bacterium]